VAERDGLVEGEEEVEGGRADALLVDGVDVVGDDLRKKKMERGVERKERAGERNSGKKRSLFSHLAQQAQRLQVLQDIGALVGDQQEVHVLRMKKREPGRAR
jgi:hypothetical protein